MSDIILTPDDAGVPLQVGRADCKSCGGSAIVRPEVGAPVAGAEPFAGVTNFVDALRWVRDNRRKTKVCNVPAFTPGVFSVPADTQVNHKIFSLDAPDGARIYRVELVSVRTDCGDVYAYLTISGRFVYATLINRTSGSAPAFGVKVSAKVSTIFDIKPSEDCSLLRYSIPKYTNSIESYAFTSSYRVDKVWDASQDYGFHFVDIYIPAGLAMTEIVSENVYNVRNSRNNGRTSPSKVEILGGARNALRVTFHTTCGSKCKLYNWVAFTITATVRVNGCFS